MRRVAGSIGLLLCALLFSCVSVLGLEGFGGAAVLLCQTLEDCYGSKAYPGCQQHVAGGLEAASPQARAQWLTAFEGCTDNCTNAKACLDRSPICGGLKNSCAQTEHCCGFQDGISDCLEGSCCASNGQTCTPGSDSCCTFCEETTGTCGGEAPCKGRGEACADNIDCCSQNCLSGVCEQVCRQPNEACSDPEECCTKICEGGLCRCRGEGESCSFPEDCCGELSCEQGTCQLATGCVPLLQQCAPSDNCCGDTASCDSGYTFCCVANGLPCPADPINCCGAGCNELGTCCALTFQLCNGDTDCCVGTCNGTVCQCVEEGGRCNLTSDCCMGTCTGDGGCQCNPHGCHDGCEAHPQPLSRSADCGAQQPVGGVSQACVSEVCFVDESCCCDSWHEGCVTLALSIGMNPNSPCKTACENGMTVP